MAHILAQKQLRSIILSVSLTMPFSFNSLPLSLHLLLCLSLSSSLFGWCLCAEERNTFLLPCLLLSLVTGYYLLYLLMHTCSHFLPLMLLCVLNLISPSRVPSLDLYFLTFSNCHPFLTFSLHIKHHQFLLSPALPLPSPTHLLCFPVCPSHHEERDPEQHTHQ